MGACLSTVSKKTDYIDQPNGNQDDYKKRYLEGRILGEGEFGVVKLVHDMGATGSAQRQDLACKELRKGVVFKDNVLYSPIKPHVLKMECAILRALAGQRYCLKLVGVYETPKLIYVVTEFCQGGEMMEYVAQQRELRTEDVSRISFQLLSAVDHCANHNVIHRDIKPENCMFQTSLAGAQLRLIDFGSGTKDDNVVTTTNGGAPDLIQHTTFAGSAFYISPEMFQHVYTSKTDVWSAGVTLYVLVAGYPSDELQKAFNILQTSKQRNLEELPHLPPDMPQSFLDMLEELLVYRHKSRKSAGYVLSKSDFCKFHKEHRTSSVNEPGGSKRMNRTRSIVLSSSVQRHSMVLNYQQFERSITTLLATMLTKIQLDALLKDISRGNNNASVTATNKTSKNLGIIPIKELVALLKRERHDNVIEIMNRQPNAAAYSNFAYHVALLQEFSKSAAGGGSSAASLGGGGMNRSLSISSNNINIAQSSSINGGRKFQPSKSMSTTTASNGNGAARRTSLPTNLKQQQPALRASMPPLSSTGAGRQASLTSGSKGLDTRPITIMETDEDDEVSVESSTGWESSDGMSTLRGEQPPSATVSLESFELLEDAALVSIGSDDDDEEMSC